MEYTRWLGMVFGFVNIGGIFLSTKAIDLMYGLRAKQFARVNPTGPQPIKQISWESFFIFFIDFFKK